jgi:hypothetical protein
VRAPLRRRCGEGTGSPEAQSSPHSLESPYRSRFPAALVHLAQRKG